MEGAVQGYTEREATARACNGRGYDQARHAGHCYRVPTESHRHVCAQLVCNSLMSEFEVQFRDDSPASVDQLHRLLFKLGILLLRVPLSRGFEFRGQLELTCSYNLGCSMGRSCEHFRARVRAAMAGPEERQQRSRRLRHVARRAQRRPSTDWYTGGRSDAGVAMSSV